MTLKDFLLARIDDDESFAKLSLTYGPQMGDLVDPPHNPLSGRRVLAECEAKRRIVGLCSDTYIPVDAGRFIAAAVLAALALPYADHPNFREEWRNA